MTFTPDLTLFHAPRTRSIRVRWLLEEMGLPYRLEAVQFATRPPGDAGYGNIHPLRKVPALQDGDAIVLDSVAILQYLLGRYGPHPCDVRPEEADYGRYLQWTHFGESGLIMPVSLLLAHTHLLPEDKRDAKLAAWARDDIGKLLKFAATHAVGDREYIAAGRLTAADISVVYMLYLLKLIREFGDAPVVLQDYFKRMTAHPNWILASAD